MLVVLVGMNHFLLIGHIANIGLIEASRTAFRGKDIRREYNRRSAANSLVRLVRFNIDHLE